MALNSKVAIEVEIKNIKELSKLKKELAALRKEMKATEKNTADGAKLGKKAAKQYSETATKVKNKSAAVRKLNKDLRDSNTTTKNVTKSSNGMAKQFVKGAAAIGMIVGAFRAVNRVVSSVVTTFTEFEFVMAKVNAVSGATDQEFAALNETAKELGRTTFFTASQVGELMLNFSKLGFSAREIQDAVQPTLDLATATGTDLARAALVAGAAVRGFGLDASETQRVVDVMAVSFSSSAMNIEKWQTSMTKVAPIAKAAGFSIEDTAAIMSKLTDSGIEASIAGTSLRNILLKMQDPSSDLTKAFGRTIHGLDDLVPAMKAFVAEGGDMADIMEVVDLRQAAAFEQMLTTADGTLELRNALLDANGEGERMALIVGDTLQGAFLKFTSALQGFGISFMENFSGSMQKGVEGAAKFFNSVEKSAGSIALFVSNLIKLIKFIGIYKTILIATTAATSAFSLATGTASISTLRFIVSFKKLTATMMANPYVAVGALLIALATDLFGLRHQVNETNESWERMNKTIKGDVSAFQTRQKIIEALKSELVSVQDLQRAKIAAIRIDEEIAAGAKSMDAIRADAIENANSLYMESEHLKKETYIAQTMRDAQTNLDLKKKQKEELKTAIAIGKKNVKIKEGTIIQAEASKTDKENTVIQDLETDAKHDYVDVMKQVVSGTKDLKDAEIELRDIAIDRAQAELDAIPITLMDGELRLDLERRIIDLKMKGRKEEEKGAKKDKKTREESIKDLGKLGSALQEVAGENEALNGIRKAGEAITKAAAIAESLLNLQKSITLITEGKLTLSTLLGAKAKTVNTGAIAAETVAETVSLVPKATAAILNQGSGDPYSAIFRIIAMIAIISKVMSMFEKGGIVSDGADKFAKGGMVHGASHAQGGVKFAVGGRVNELEGGEAVINKRSTAMYRGQLSAMNEAGGGVKFADGGLLNSPAFAQQQFSGNRSGGGGAQKVYVVESDISKSQNQVSVLEAAATI